MVEVEECEGLGAKTGGGKKWGGWWIGRGQGGNEYLKNSIALYLGCQCCE